MAPNILVVGAGAIGAVYGWRLSRIANVAVVCRSNYEKVCREGFRIRSAKWGDDTWHPTQVTRSVHEAAQKFKYDYCFVSLKNTPDIVNICDIIEPAITPSLTSIILAQNGINIVEPVAKRFPQNSIASAALYIGASQLESGEVVQYGNELMKIGLFPRKGADEKVGRDQFERFVGMLNKCGSTTEAVDNMPWIRWHKNMWNAAFSSIQVLTGAPVGAILESPSLVGLVTNIMNELIDIGEAIGFEIPADTVDKYLELTRVTTKYDYKSSMYLDHLQGKPLEVEVILGNPLRMAKARGLNAPHLESLYSLVKTVHESHVKKQKL
ncbi:uncharacterized protein VTP21DRAFT_2840 [Calcarisporiella thermophila]|uniref:uncharacterized protein n=1 Tax=Calcarisporiella thermophila TaxID=911321 RepID=UPI0037433B3E